VRKPVSRIEPAFAGATRGHDGDLSARGRRIDSLAVVCAVLAMGAIVTNAIFLQKGPHPAPIFSSKPPQQKPVAQPVFPLRPIQISPAPAQPPAAAPEQTGNVAIPRPRPVETEGSRTEAPVPATARPRTEIVADIQKELSRRGFYDGATDGVYGAKTDSAIRDFEQAAHLKPGGSADEAMLRTIKASPVRVQPKVAAASENPPRPPDPISELIAPPSKRVIAVQRVLAEYGYGQIKPTGTFDRQTEDAIEQFERARKLPVTRQISPRLMRELAAVTGRPLE
jgi:peptidoglycan hydrolase-like protein with peptidoglycan-binding domain